MTKKGIFDTKKGHFLTAKKRPKKPNSLFLSNVTIYTFKPNLSKKYLKNSKIWPKKAFLTQKRGVAPPQKFLTRKKKMLTIFTDFIKEKSKQNMQRFTRYRDFKNRAIWLVESVFREKSMKWGFPALTTKNKIKTPKDTSNNSHYSEN